MFYAMMTWMFWRRGSDRLSRLVMLLMAILTAQCLFTTCFLDDFGAMPQGMWNVVTGVDVVVIPIYAFILFKLCRPGALTLKQALLHELPFAALILALIILKAEIVYYILVGYSFVYGCYCFVWTMVNIPRYHKQLKERFSYEENIDLNWLKFILFSFFLILGLWFVCSITLIIDTELAYMLSSLVVWMFICYFIYRHESVLGEFKEPEAVVAEETKTAEAESQLKKTITRLFDVEKIYLDPKLKLSDVARMANTNRTYVSAFFNAENGISFFEYVNRWRIDHAARLLRNTDMMIKDIATKSGFSSLSTFHRVFQTFKGCSPADYRNNTSDN